jgi:hypothetical protein
MMGQLPKGGNWNIAPMQGRGDCYRVSGDAPRM